MLKVIYGDLDDVIYNTSVFFKFNYDPEWFSDPDVIQMVKDVDDSVVLGNGAIDSPVLGPIPVTKLSGGVKTLILVNNDKSGRIFNASTCGDNCARWLLEIGKNKDVTVNLRHMMDFGGRKFTVKVLNNGRIAHSMSELIDLAGEYVWRPQK